MKLAAIGFGAFGIGTLYLLSELWRDLVEQDIAHGEARLRAARETQDVRQALGCLADRIGALEAAKPKPRARKAKP